PLPISRPGDHDEREADSVADDITASAAPDLTATPTPDGGPLPASARGFFEVRLGADLSAVRVHHGQRAHRAAAALGARSYTAGNDVTFADGQYAPDRPQGARLLAHELTHVAQTQRGAPNAIRRQPFSDGLTPDDVIVRNAPFTPPQPSTDPLARYPTLITSLDNAEYEALERAVAAYRPYEPIPPTLTGTTCPLNRLLDLDARPVEMGSIAVAVLPNLLTGSPDPLSLALVMRNEVLRRFLTQYYPLDTATVSIEIQRLIGPPQAPPKGASKPPPAAGTPANPPELAFVLGEQTIPIGDGLVHLADLDRAVGGRVGSIAADVQQEVDKLADGASRILS
ncbi:MAG: DUF4157 domain-containing protein, partial [Mycobacterium sp.]|nr:DUF4157 domain-containing protein [Mycobacterium sp.]